MTLNSRVSSWWVRARTSISHLQPWIGLRGTMTTHHNWAAPIPKKLYCFSGKMLLVSMGTWQGRGRPGVGLGSIHYKIKGFYKKCYKLVSKQNPREAGGGSRERGGYTEGGPEPWTTNDGIQAGREGVEGSWEGDTKCINVPPQTLLRQRQRGTEATAWDMGEKGLQPSPRQGPHRNGHCLRLPDGKDLHREGREELMGADRGG